jgi:hypothetical protein
MVWVVSVDKVLQVLILLGCSEMKICGLAACNEGKSGRYAVCGMASYAQVGLCTELTPVY